LAEELKETAPTIWLTIRDADDNVVRRLKAPAKKGFHRVNWDLRHPDRTVVSMPSGEDDGDEPTGFLVAPGEYTVSLSKRVRGETTELVAAKPFMVERLRQGALPPQDDVVEFWTEVSEFDRTVSAAAALLGEVEAKIGQLKIAAERASGNNPDALDDAWQAIRDEANELDEIFNGNAAMNVIRERQVPSIRERLGNAMFGVSNSTYGPTQTHRDQFGYAKDEYDAFEERLMELANTTIPDFEEDLMDAGAPRVSGGKIP